MGLEEELRPSLKDPFSLILALVALGVYLALFAVYLNNKPDPVFLNMSFPLAYALFLWLVIAVAIVLAALKVWR
ncbi:MAG: hypothetical protein NZ902_06115 [Acidilobaceae archaeon]|nr:hypothetical protein [Acidilobaceae archaeon]